MCGGRRSAGDQQRRQNGHYDADPMIFALHDEIPFGLREEL
jgi:hypothetical protein